MHINQSRVKAVAPARFAQACVPASRQRSTTTRGISRGLTQIITDCHGEGEAGLLERGSPVIRADLCGIRGDPWLTAVPVASLGWGTRALAYDGDLPRVVRRAVLAQDVVVPDLRFGRAGG